MFRQNDDLRTLVNAGFTSAAQVVRIVGDALEPRTFTVYTRKRCTYWKLTDTIESRSINTGCGADYLTTHRRLRATAIKASGRYLQNCRWTMDNWVEIQSRAEIDSVLSDRQADVWRGITYCRLGRRRLAAAIESRCWNCARNRAMKATIIIRAF